MTLLRRKRPIGLWAIRHSVVNRSLRSLGNPRGGRSRSCGPRRRPARPVRPRGKKSSARQRPKSLCGPSWAPCAPHPPRGLGGRRLSFLSWAAPAVGGSVVACFGGCGSCAPAFVPGCGAWKPWRAGPARLPPLRVFVAAVSSRTRARRPATLFSCVVFVRPRRHGAFREVVGRPSLAACALKFFLPEAKARHFGSTQLSPGTPAKESARAKKPRTLPAVELFFGLELTLASAPGRKFRYHVGPPTAKPPTARRAGPSSPWSHRKVSLRETDEGCCARFLCYRLLFVAVAALRCPSLSGSA